jgi:hypothetical protein
MWGKPREGQLRSTSGCLAVLKVSLERQALNRPVLKYRGNMAKCDVSRAGWRGCEGSEVTTCFMLHMSILHNQSPPPPNPHRTPLNGPCHLGDIVVSFLLLLCKVGGLDTTLQHLTSETRDEQQLFPLEFLARLLWTDPVSGPPSPIHYKQKRRCFADKAQIKQASALAVL